MASSKNERPSETPLKSQKNSSTTQVIRDQVPVENEKLFNRNRFLTRRLENKLDKMIGFYFWKTYVATTLYANISTPINLTITIFTALMTAHSSTSSSFISNEMNMKMNLVTFLISILNSYFTPQKEFNELNEYIIKWSDIGNRFEKAIYTSNSYEEKIECYTKLLDEASTLYKEQYIKKRNFLTDLLHTLIKKFFMNSNDRWMKDGTFDFYEKIEDVIELDFDLEELKYEQQKESFFEKICCCFKICFSCCRRNTNNHREAPLDVVQQGKSSSDRRDSSNTSNRKNYKLARSVLFDDNPGETKFVTGGTQVRKTESVVGLSNNSILSDPQNPNNEKNKIIGHRFAPSNEMGQIDEDEKSSVELTDIKIN